MSRLERTMATAGRAVAWLLPAGRRDWIVAVWAEAHDVPPGLERLAWRAGGVWMLAREALMPRRVVRAALFAVAAAMAAWTAWPNSSVRPLVYHAPHMSAAAANGHVLHASQHVSSYITMCVTFPIIGLIMSAWAWPASCRCRPSPARSRETAAARQAPGLSPHPSLRPPAVASPTPRNASPSFHDRGQFGAHSTGSWP
jgi:hypothetical protein